MTIRPLIFNHHAMTFSHRYLSVEVQDPNPLNLPPFTIRVKYEQGTEPSHLNRVLVDASENIWDITQTRNGWDYMFQSETGLIEVLGANTTGVISMGGLFDRCTSLTDVAFFDTRTVTAFWLMFGQCTLLTTIPHFYTGNATNMHGMMGYCSSLTSFPNLITTNVTNMKEMFRNCSSLTSIPNLDTRNVTNMQAMFAYTSLNYMPQIDTSNVEIMSSMFLGATNLKEIRLINTSKVISVDMMFGSARRVERGALALYTQMATQSNPPSNHVGTFSGCGSQTETGQAELAQIPSDWK